MTKARVDTSTTEVSLPSHQNSTRVGGVFVESQKQKTQIAARDKFARNSQRAFLLLYN